MAAPEFTICEAGTTTLYDAGNPIQLLNADKGIPSAPLTVDLWNDRTLSAGSDTAVNIEIYAANDDDISVIFDGTTKNGFQSMLECRSRLASSGVPADLQDNWTPISPGSTLPIGDMPAGTKRTLELRLNPPTDASTVTLKDFFLFVSPG